ncbi:Sterol uptake control protein 2 [Ceratocystis fimbriata CBS 114723]|uniref:Sterol uptake control protein 2 n=1 Tax=Ceratocystis fimbriata CBS 114723 TaxID=1035309 RepID=A0A2C5XHB9_9PEZI|nr:Sterol uptake control protein 2 [Ceratocystis fimbriata CBS 114723]
MDSSFLVLSLRAPENSAGTDSNAGVREYKRRRYHTKSRRGCGACRQKRVKCDQTKPICTRCNRNNRQCVYADPWPNAPSVAPPNGPASRNAPPTTRPRHSILWGSLSSDSSESSPPPSSPSSKNVALVPSPRILLISYVKAMNDMGHNHTGTSIDALVHHFLGNGGTFIGNPLFSTSACKLWTSGDDSPHLRSSILAFTACHLRFHSIESSQHSLAELSQEAVALPQFQQALSTPLSPRRGDTLILTALVLSMLSWAVTLDDDPRASWVYKPSHDSSKLGWLNMMLGLRPVLLATLPFREKSMMWRAISQTTEVGDQPSGPMSGHVTGTGHDLDMERIPEQWRHLAYFSWTNADAENIQYLIPPLTTLTAMRGFRPSIPDQLLPYFQLLCRLQLQFRNMLAENDVRTLWIIAYMFAVMSHVDLWWCTDKLRRDLRAIRLYLGEAGLTELEGEKGALWRGLLRELETTAAPGFLDHNAVAVATKNN